MYKSDCKAKENSEARMLVLDTSYDLLAISPLGLKLSVLVVLLYNFPVLVAGIPNN